MKDTTKAMIELAMNSDDQIDPKIEELIAMALAGQLPKSSDQRIQHTDDQPLLLKMTDAAKRLGVSRVTFWRLVNAGTIMPIEIFEGVFRYSYCDIMNFAEQRSKYQPKVRGTPKIA